MPRSVRLSREEAWAELDRAHTRIRADALELESGRRELQDHIADVAHFVRPDTPLDREA